jgi:Ca-activated chloride channel family protein
MGATGRVADAKRIAVDMTEETLPARAQLSLAIADELAPGSTPESSSHSILSERDRGETAVQLADDGAALDRDVVVRWQAAGDAVKTTLAQARPATGDKHADHGYGLLTLLPPLGHQPSDEVARDVIVLIDTSGSMHGEPIEQARRVSLALIDTLGARDSLTMIEFSMQPRRWRDKPSRATDAAKADAAKWLKELRASGGTEMHSAIIAALDSMRGDAQRQVVLISDGLIGFEDEIVGAVLERCPNGSRVHCVGVGSAVNRSLTGAASRAGRGYEAIVGIGEDPERIAQRLVARTAAPIVVDLELSGSALSEHAPMKLPDLFGGSPALISLKLDPRGGELCVRGLTPKGPWECQLQVAPMSEGEGDPAVTALYGREAVADLEMLRATGRDVDERVTALGLSFQIATRLTSWVAVSSEVTVDPSKPTRRETMPHQLPHGMSVEGLGLRAAQPPLMRSLSLSAPMAARAPAAPPAAYGAPPPPPGMGAPPPGPPPPPAAAPAPPPPPQARQRRTGARKAEEPSVLSEGAADAPADFDDEMALEAPMEAAEQEAAQPPRRSRGIARRLIDGVRDMFGGGADELQFSGRVALQKDDLLVIEIDIATDCSWQPSTITIELSDGSLLDVEVDHDKTTAAGNVSAGQTVRLALRWTGGELVGTPKHVRLDSAGTNIDVTL